VDLMKKVRIVTTRTPPPPSGSAPAAPLLDYEHLRRVVPITAVLEYLGLGRGFKRSGSSRLVGSCPLCKSTAKRCFVIDTDKHHWFCFACCRGGGTLELLAEVFGIDLPRGAALIADWFAIRDPACAFLQARTQRSCAMSESKKFPDFEAFVVEEVTEEQLKKDPQRKAYWQRVGACFPFQTKDGKAGLNLVLNPGISVSGRVTLLHVTDEDRPKRAAEKAARQGANPKGSVPVSKPYGK
jgi:hypothetical protein